jgi:hypothetical protein
MCCRRNFGKVRLYRTFPVNTSTTSIPHTQRRSAATMVFPNTAPRTLSRIENLPTEIVQHIASYLIHESYYPANSSFEHLKAKPSSVPDGLLELRETSHTMVAKVEHVFKRLFTVKTLTFYRYSLKRLVQLSHSPAYSPLVKTLVFMPMSEAWHETSPYMANWRATDLLEARRGDGGRYPAATADQEHTGDKLVDCCVASFRRVEDTRGQSRDAAPVVSFGATTQSAEAPSYHDHGCCHAKRNDSQDLEYAWRPSKIFWRIEASNHEQLQARTSNLQSPINA